jgi:hypothetical protein
MLNTDLREQLKETRLYRLQYLSDLRNTFLAAKALSQSIIIGEYTKKALGKEMRLLEARIEGVHYSVLTVEADIRSLDQVNIFDSER